MDTDALCSGTTGPFKEECESFTSPPINIKAGKILPPLKFIKPVSSYQSLAAGTCLLSCYRITVLRGCGWK